MFGSRKQKIRQEFDNKLLSSIDLAKQEWDHAKETEEAVSDVDEDITAQTVLARQKYLFLYREARLRKVHGQRIQSSVFDY